jgi:hypothetical protein
MGPLAVGDAGAGGTRERERVRELLRRVVDIFFVIE